VQFAIMSLLAFGGANAVVPEMHRQAVELRGWMTEREFTDMFAMSQAAPGPNVMLVTLIGYHVAGVAGALITTLAMCGPTAVLAHFLGTTWDRFKMRVGGSPCRRALSRFRSAWSAPVQSF
jgi:chromate transporter